jgi:hypothetical protein
MKQPSRTRPFIAGFSPILTVIVLVAALNIISGIEALRYE